MPAIERQVMVAVFEDEYHAKNAIDALESMGFGNDQVGIAVREGGFTAHCILDNLLNLGVPEEEVNYYRREFEVGHVIVAVKFNCSKQELIDFLLNNCGPEQFGVSITGISISSQPESQEASSTEPDDVSSLWKLLKDANLDHLL